MASFLLGPYLAKQKRRVDLLLAYRIDELASHSPARLLEAMRYSVLSGGKRLRPILCLTFAQAMGTVEASPAVAEDAAVAIEFIHTYSLIHDDLPAMDNDDLRRGQPSCHRRFGEAMAILAGDALLTDAFHVIANGEQLHRREIARLLANAAGPRGMVAGQVMDIDDQRPPDEAFLTRMHQLKTGALIQAACVAGAICSGTSTEVAMRYGEAFGLAFQITDDLLDVTGDPRELGKRAGSDAAAGRHTFASVAGLKRARDLAQQQSNSAIEAAKLVEPTPGPLAALARFSVERRY